MRIIQSFCGIASRFFWMGMMLVASTVSGEQDVLRSSDTTKAISQAFSSEDEALLDEIQEGCFRFLWKEVGSPVPLVKDRLTNDRVSSLAGVGFQLSAIPIGVERGWITRQEGHDRALAILQGIIPRTDNKKFGIYLHYVDLNEGGMHQDKGLQVQASTIDHALLQAGAMTAASYFDGEVAGLVDKMVADANWKIYQTQPEGFVSFGWRPDDEGHDLDKPGDFRPWNWHDASAEEQIVTFLAVGTPVADHTVPPEVYYRLHRVLKQHKDMAPYAVSWGGPAFTYFFNHCWIDYRSLRADSPSDFGVDQPSIDWFENSSRAMLTHRQRCIEKSDEFKTMGPNSWGLSPAADVNPDGTMGYIVQSVRPNLEEKDNFCGGTVTPYAAGSAIMFVPELSVKALRHFRNLKDEEGNYVVWREFSKGGYGLLDSFNLDRNEQQGTPDYISIDEGPMLLAIENARTGLVWKLFMQHPSAQLAIERLRLKKLAE
ncbi:hypothetical protein Pr1d_27540 [Bythopirellula goksoeyrii]|uniref:Glycoamylase-like domain-containing protein n=2 Tax=Bythopirellula goksoeyrii TaxID=1400387 RepID=A0A5B9QCW3_9BACT|nr:hypothetical protein Pr1d_27540 [Bythopirellula goksoeyrii]